jgi:hypothetical protein
MCHGRRVEDLTGGACASEAEGEDSHRNCTVALAAVDGGVGCKYVGYRFWGVRLGGHIERCLGGY